MVTILVIVLIYSQMNQRSALYSTAPRQTASFVPRGPTQTIQINASSVTFAFLFLEVNTIMRLGHAIADRPHEMDVQKHLPRWA
jgi:hypothetical protein